MKETLKALTEKQRAKALKALPLWTLSSNEKSIHRTYTFSDHLDGLVFIARATVHAQVLDHHPEIVFSYKKVKVILTTHSVKGLSTIDFEYAKRIEALVHKTANA